MNDIVTDDAGNPMQTLFTVDVDRVADFVFHSEP